MFIAKSFPQVGKKRNANLARMAVRRMNTDSLHFISNVRRNIVTHPSVIPMRSDLSSTQWFHTSLVGRVKKDKLGNDNESDEFINDDQLLSSSVAAVLQTIKLAWKFEVPESCAEKDIAYQDMFSLLGTACYRAPEIVDVHAAGQDYIADPSADIWSFGSMMVRLAFDMTIREIKVKFPENEGVEFFENQLKQFRGFMDELPAPRC